MNNRMPLIDTRMVGALDDFFPQECTIQSPVETQSSTGYPAPVFNNVAGMVDIPCRIAPAGGSEVKRTDQIITVGSHTIVLQGYYSTIITKIRAVISSVNYDILAVGFDAENKTTRLNVEIVS